ncbi:hypothetical protein C8F04DRAFT_1404029 [Mycena alexandri]|uniref:Uncharacterized protein n=1 Tax=Mycena alexandri TaxID=1745969 RepID=A0AAD6S2M3_9AGAR|nr:hypothetical protein C8F04DRAFT_1404029 [Mycena alexandri]
MSSSGPLTPLESEQWERDLIAAQEEVNLTAKDYLQKREEHQRVQGLAKGRKGSGKANKIAVQAAYEEAERASQQAIQHLNIAQSAAEAFRNSEQPPDAAELERAMAAAAEVKRVEDEARDAAERKEEAAAAEAKRVEDEVKAVAAAKKVKDDDAAGRADVQRVEDEARDAAERKKAEEAIAEVKRVEDTAKATASEYKRKRATKEKKKNGEDDGEADLGANLKAIDEEDDSSEDESHGPKRPRIEEAEDLRKTIRLLKQIVTDSNMRLQSCPTEDEGEGLKVGLKNAREGIIAAEKSLSTLEKKQNDAPSKASKKDIENWWRLSFDSAAKGYDSEYYEDDPIKWRADLEAAAEIAINKFLEDSKNTIPSYLRRLMRMIPEFAIRSGTTNEALALHVLETTVGNGANGRTIKCRFHAEKRHQVQAQQVDGPTAGKYFIVGVPYLPGVKSLAEDGILSCGCDKAVVLLDFFWQKTWRLQSTNPKIIQTESMKHDVVDSRHRAFFVQAYTNDTLLTVNDLYTHSQTEYGSREYKCSILRIQAFRACQIANANAMEGDEQLLMLMGSKEKIGACAASWATDPRV